MILKKNERDRKSSAMSGSKVMPKYCKCAAKYWQLEPNDVMQKI